jgi:hypothetical protein
MFERLWTAMFGRTLTQRRSPEDVDALVLGYQSQETTKVLFDFVRALLKANDDRTAAVDSKATMLIGYSTAILAFLLTRGPGLVGEPWWLVFLRLMTGIFAAVACVSAGMAIRSARNWQNMGEATWFPVDRETIGDPDKLGRWYVRAMHESLRHNHEITNKKAGEMICAQLAVAGAGFCLAVSLAGGALAALLNNVQ